MSSSSKKYEIIEVLGKGSQGVVFKCSTKDSRKRTCAMKRILVADISEANEAINELNKVRTLESHPGIAEYKELILDDHDGMILVCIILKYYESDLSKYIDHIYKENKSSIEEMKILKFVEQLSSALSFLHKSGIVHRDLKPGNIFMDRIIGEGENEEEMINSEEKPIFDNSRLVIGDFGLSSNFSELSLKSTFCGTPYYLAPEMMKGSYSELCDIFSLGACLYSLAIGEERMFYLEFMKNKDELVSDIRNKFSERKRSSFLTDLCLDCLNEDPTLRPSASSILVKVQEQIKKIENLGGWNSYIESETLQQQQKLQEKIQQIQQQQQRQSPPNNSDPLNPMNASSNTNSFSPPPPQQQQQLYPRTNVSNSYDFFKIGNVSGEEEFIPSQQQQQQRIPRKHLISKTNFGSQSQKQRRKSSLSSFLMNRNDNDSFDNEEQEQNEIPFNNISYSNSVSYNNSRNNDIASSSNFSPYQSQQQPQLMTKEYYPSPPLATKKMKNKKTKKRKKSNRIVEKKKRKEIDHEFDDNNIDNEFMKQKKKNQSLISAVKNLKSAQKSVSKLKKKNSEPSKKKKSKMIRIRDDEEEPKRKFKSKSSRPPSSRKSKMKKKVVGHEMRL